MKKIYATQVDDEFVDCERFLDDEMLVSAGIAIYGNRDFADMNSNMITDTIIALENCKYDLDVVRDDLEDGTISEDDYEAEMLDTIDNYFNKSLSKEVKLKLIDLCDNFAVCSSRDEDDFIVEALSLNTGKKYHVRSITGYSQGDYNDLYYPEGTAESFIDYIEACYFGTGTEFAITEEPVELEELDEADYYFDYTALYKLEDIKNWIAVNMHVSPEEVVVRTIKDRHTSYTYEYEER